MSSQISLADLSAHIVSIRERIENAADRAGRPAEDVTLVAVTKTFPLETVRLAYEAGLRDFGENRVQELVEKSAALPGEATGGDVRWHAIGSLQRNKAKDVARRADLFHALDSERLANALDRQAAEAGRILPVLVQVNISGEDSKGGVEPSVAHDFIERVAERANLKISGMMGMAAPADSESDVERVVRPAFAHLRELLDSYSGAAKSGLTVLSMGMSSDFEVAVEEGATHVRVGSALFGAR